MHNDYTMFYRVVPSGKKVVYYYAYNDQGERIGPWSTGLENKTAARNYCNALIRKNLLVPGIKGMTMFSVFAADFWDWDKSVYLKERRKRKGVTQSYTDKCQRVTDHTLIPYFGGMRMDSITGEVVDKWLDYMIAQKYEHKTINGYFGTLRTMMRWASKKKYIVRDPFLDVEKLVEEKKKKLIATQEEFKELFCGDWKKVWNNDLLRYTANKLAALTGMRVCEILGFKGEFLFNDHIFVCGQYDKYGYRKTKTKLEHHIPLTAEMINDLKKLKKVNGNGYLFSLTGGDKPVSVKHIFNGFCKAVKNIGISEEERLERKLNVHAWRHFANTEMQVGGMTIQQVQAYIGHKSAGSTEIYTHFDPLQFGNAKKIQEKLLKPKEKKQTKQKPKTEPKPKAEKVRPALAIYKPENDEALKQKQAS